MGKGQALNQNSSFSFHCIALFLESDFPVRGHISLSSLHVGQANYEISWTEWKQKSWMNITEDPVCEKCVCLLHISSSFPLRGCKGFWGPGGLWRQWKERGERKAIVDRYANETYNSILLSSCVWRFICQSSTCYPNYTGGLPSCSGMWE